MEHKKSLSHEDIVFMLLETLKSNGTFDEFRRQCVNDIDAKPTYQNWKQRIESNVKKFLSKVKYTPELNKNTVRERLRKHLLDGRETRDIEEGADRILTQVLAPRTLSIFQPKIANAVNEYLGIKTETPQIELNGLKQSSMDLKNVSKIETSTVFNTKIDSIPVSDDKTQKADSKDSRSDKKEKPSSLCKEPKSMNGNRSDDENDAGGSSKEINSQYKNKTFTSDKTKSSSSNHKSSRKDNSCKEVVDKYKVVEKSKEIVEKPKEVVNNSKDADNKSNDLIDKSNDAINKPKDVVEKSKDTIEKPKDAINKSNDFIDKPKDDANKTKDIVDMSKDKSFLSKNSNSSSHKRSRTDKKRAKRSLEEKKKSSSLCKEPKLLNGNRSDDESNSGGSSKQKKSIHKSKSSSSGKSKSASSNHKSSRKDNSSTDVIDKSKSKTSSKNSSCTDLIDESKDKSISTNCSSTDNVDKSKTKSTSSKNSSCTDDVDKSSKVKSSMSKNSSSTISVEKSKDKSFSKVSSSHKCKQTNNKRLKLSLSEKNQLPTNNLSVEEKTPENPEWNDFRTTIITNDEQDAANVLLSISGISYESSHNEIITENIIFIENSSPTTQTLEKLKAENELETKENSDQIKICPSNDIDVVTENSEVKSSSLETPQSLKSVKSENNVTNFSNILFEKVCSVNIERMSSEDVKLQCSSVNNVKITNELQKPSEIVVVKNEFDILNNEVNMDLSSENEQANENNSNDILKVPKLKLKLLPNQIDSIIKSKRKKHHKNKETKKVKPSKLCDISSEVAVSVIDGLSTNKICEKIDRKSNCDTDVKNNDFALSDQILQKEIENNSAIALDNDKSVNTFIGFTEMDGIPSKNHTQFKNFFKTLQTKINHHTVIVDGFKGFTHAETLPYKQRDVVYAEFIKLKESTSSTDFKGFSKAETQKSIGHNYAKHHLELAKKQDKVDNQQQNIKSGGNGLQNGKTFNKVMAILYESNNENNATTKEIYNQPNDNNKKDSATVNNNNHNHDNWVVEQEMKYKLLPVKVKLERLMEYRCNNAKRVSESPQVPI